MLHIVPQSVAMDVLETQLPYTGSRMRLSNGTLIEQDG